MKQGSFVHRRLTEYAQLPTEQIFSQLNTSPRGLSEQQIDDQIKLYGENRILGRQKDTILYRLRRAFVNPFSIVLFLLAAISFLTDVIFASNFTRNVTTVVIILVMLLISGIVRFIQEIRAKQITDKLVQLINTTVQVRRNGHWEQLDSESLVVGDIIRLDAGDRVPADIRLFKASDFFVTQSVITGESGILEKTADTLPAAPLNISDYTNTVFLGSTITGGIAEGVVVAVGEDTFYGGFSPKSIAHKNGFDRGENSIAWVLIKFMAILVPIVFVASGLTKGNWLEAFLFALSVAVGLTPELLPMVITACLTRGSLQMGQKQTVVKNINAMQGFGSMDILCVDKTGTLTGDKILLEYYLDILGNESMEVLDYAFLNSYYHTGVSNHLDLSILKALEMPRYQAHFSNLIEKHQKLDELPFDYNRKLSSVLLQSDDKSFLTVKGSIDQVISRCKYVEYKGELHPFGPDGLKHVHDVVDEMLCDGMKVVAIAGKSIDGSVIHHGDEYDLVLLGYLVFFDAPKQSAISAIEKLHKQHINVKVLTGDHTHVAASICRRIGISTDAIITGAQLDLLSDNELPLRIENTNIFAELSPKQKSHIVEILQENGHTVGFLGDGMNDLPAVIQADVGISVDTATDAVKESADVILLKKDLNVLSDGVLEGRKAFANMSKYIKITASSNFGNICAIVIASVLLPFFPMTSVQILLLNLLYDMLCLVLPWDNVDSELSHKPLEWTGRPLSRFMIFFGPISSIFDIITFAFLYFVLCPAICGGSYDVLGADGQLYFISLFQTGWFLESMWTQVLILHLLRTKKLPFVQSNPSQPVVVVTVLGILLFTALTMSPLGSFLGLVAMPLSYFVFLVITVSLYLLLGTLMKAVYIRMYHQLT